MTRDERREIRRNRSGNSRVWTGLLLLLIGGLLLLQRMGTPLPYWLLTWQVLLIGLGFFIGIRRGFRGGAWLAMMLVGGIFFAGDFYPEWELRHYTAPIILIIIGVVFVLRPRHRGSYMGGYNTQGNPNAFSYNQDTASTEDFLDVVSVLGGIKKNIMCKDFKGGEVTSFLGGAEINLSQADIKGRVVLELTQVFGGAKLIVPSNWDVKPELVSVFGGVEDKRQLTGNIDPEKVLVLKGTSVFGGIEIRSY